MVEKGIVLGHLVSFRGIKVDKAKIDIIQSLPYPTSMREVHFFLGHASFYRDSSRSSPNSIAPMQIVVKRCGF